MASHLPEGSTSVGDSIPDHEDAALESFCLNQLQAVRAETVDPLPAASDDHGSDEEADFVEQVQLEGSRSDLRSANADHTGSAFLDPHNFRTGKLMYENGIACFDFCQGRAENYFTLALPDPCIVLDVRRFVF